MTAFKLPVLLDFDHERRDSRGRPDFKLGRGKAGWTVIEFATAEDRLAFMNAHAYAAMPCWRRIAGWLPSKGGDTAAN